MSKLIIPFLLMIIITACKPEVQSPAAGFSNFFNVDSLIRNQIHLLSEIKPKVQKQVIIDGLEENKTFQPDSALWVDELEAFLVIDINKPVNRDRYTQRTLQTDLEKMLIYEQKEDSENGIQALRIVKNPQGQVVFIEAYEVQRNMLYSSLKKFTLSFEMQESKSVLSSYSVEGDQDILFKNPFSYKVEAKVSY